MTKWDELLDEDVAANRTDAKRAVVISIVAFAVMVAASALIVLAGIPSP
ncbi:hypothetical protein [Antiquaquibacter soli]|uniref:Uncharacterized protein n=1 Tax=Antiquaquibacter soli TaxID=3064523 RepID=A0ABT9BPT7_9MICO|nr:hypothetical protein [Protaetiibacter sp. WY-16]MDO7883051.1 hypothetical protein [Protaetiibacter sp. WY-16]